MNNWVGGSITGDIINSIQKTFRKEALQEWQQNVEAPGQHRITEARGPPARFLVQAARRLQQNRPSRLS